MKNQARKLQELIGLAMKVHAETEYCVFINFSGHVDSISISVRKSKKNYSDTVVEGEFYFQGSLSTYAEERYRNMRNALLEILETGEFDPFSEHVEPVERIEIDYTF